ncbi:MAG: glycosyltransferase family 4 protein [Alphaproteobacteria bacterium]|nr:glycosyltransferase family 4 protein [Alphaproteobacteria bacterium]
MASTAPRRVLFEVTGLFHWYAFFSHPSGMQRVIGSLVASPVLRRDPRVEFVVRMLSNDIYFRIDGDLLADLDVPERRRATIARLRGLFTKGVRYGRLRRLLADSRYFHIPYAYFSVWRFERLVEAFFARRWPSRLPPLEPVPPPGPDDVIFHPGDLFWEKRGVDVLIALKARTGVRLVTMIHDLIVVERPDWCHPSAPRLFTGAIEKLAPHVDRWMTNSAFVTGRLTKYLEERGLSVGPTAQLPMGWDSFDHLAETEDAAGRAGDAAVLQRLGLGDRPFILFVGTVEPRKNLPTLLDALAALRRELGARVPDLVIIGGRGWRSADVRARLRKDPQIHWFRGTTDADLAVLYRRARFSVAPSFTEGWGLPVQESLAHGLPCIASSGGAQPEAAHGLAELFDPTDIVALKAAMARWITDEAALAEARARIARGLPTASLPTWNDAAKFLLEYAFDEAR